MKNSKLRSIGVLLLLVVMAFSLMTGVLAQNQDVEIKVSNPDWWQQLREKYEGVKVKVLTDSSTPSLYIDKSIVPQFEQLTGINVLYETTSFDEMYSKGISDLVRGTGIYDVIYIEQDSIGAYVQKGWLADLTSMMEDKPDLVDPELDMDDFLPFIRDFKFDGHLYAMPHDSTLKVYVYRKDLFSDLEIKQAFKDEYGYELSKPENWEQYMDIAEFFYNWGQTDEAKEKLGTRIYGHTAQAKTHPCLPYEMTETIWPPQGITNWGISPKTMRASVEHGGSLNSDAAVKALRRYVKLLDYAPPGTRTVTWEGAAGYIQAGKAVQGMLYAEFLPRLNNPEVSEAAGKLAVGLPPTTPGVLEKAKEGKGYIGYNNEGSYALTYTSKGKEREAAWLFLQFVVSKGNGPEFAEAAARVVRKSTLDSPLLEKVDKQLGGYYSLHKKYSSLFAGAPPFLTPSLKVLVEGPYLRWVSKAVAGDVTAQEALDKLAVEVDETLRKLGY